VACLRQTKERLRQLGGSRKLAADVMAFEPKFAKAVEYACANVVLCDTLDDARALKFREKVDCKVITLDGCERSVSSAGNSSSSSSKMSLGCVCV
jgi:chromosome segregation ATPase